MDTKKTINANIDNAPPPKCIQSIDYRKNCLNTFKILAAIQVMYQHTLIHLHLSMPSWLTSILAFFMGVPIFFMVSGFLMWNSVEKSKTFKDYAQKRSVRIFPELWLGVLVGLIAVVILIDGPIQWVALAVFAVTQGTIAQFWTPDFLRVYGCGTPNGSLWTMGVTIQFYIVVWFVFRLLHKQKLWKWLVALGGAFVLKLLDPLFASVLPEILYKLWGQTIIKWFWLFITGAFIAEYREQILPFLKKTWWLFLIASIIPPSFGFDFDTENYGLVTYLTRVTGLIGLAYCLPKCNVKKDISYGIYIYHMIVVNVMIELGWMGQAYHMLIVLAVTVLLAFGSYYFAEFIKRKLTKN